MNRPRLLRNARRRIACAGLAAAALLLALAAAVRWAPFPHRLDVYPAATLLLDRTGEPLRVELGPGDLDCRPGFTPRDGDWIVPALIASEDERFRSHPGIDPVAIVRAVGQNLAAGCRVSGASTLSTQVIRLLDPRPRTWGSKLAEAFQALQLERRLTKDQILAQYLDRAPFGGNLAGIEAASRRYFGKGAHDLTLGEASLLAGLPQAPSRLRPDRHPARARARQRYVLDRMVELGFIAPAQRRIAVDQRVAVRQVPYPMRAPHFAEALAGGEAAGRAVRTTLDPEWQRRAESALARQVAALRPRGVRGGAVVVIEVASGAVRALVGSPDYFSPDAGQVDGAQARRAAGSTLKPFVYALAFDRGLITPATVLADVPRAYADTDPDNFDRTFLGQVSARDALVLSLNIPVLDLTDRVGVPRLHRALRGLGLATLDRAPEHYGLGLALGHGEVRLLDLANAYAALARGGAVRPVRLTEEEPAAAGGETAFSSEAAWLVSDILSGDERAMDATGNRADAKLPRIAWKTGTSSGLRDAWTVAYNPEWVVGVWIGNPDGSASPALLGKSAAAPVAWELFREQYPMGQGPWYPRPDGVRRRMVCAESGQPPCAHCARQTEDWYLAGVTPAQPCEVHRESAVAKWSADVAAFLAQQQRGVPSEEALSILAPAEGSVYRKIAGWDAASQTLALRASGTSPVYWFVNDACVGQSGPGETLAWPLARGAHRIACSDPAGRYACTKIVVE